MRNLFRRTIGLALPSFLCGFSFLFGQDRPDAAGDFRIGLSGGAAACLHRGDFVAAGHPVTLSERREWGYSAGLVAEYAPNDVLSIASRLLYSARPRLGVDQWDASSGTGVPLTIRSEYALRYDLLDLMMRTRFLTIGRGMLGGGMGGSIGHTIALEETITERLISSADVRFVDPGGVTLHDSGRVIVYAEDEPVGNASSFRVSLRSGLFYDLSLLDRWQIVPGVYFDYELTRVLKEPPSWTPWRVNALMFQLDVSMAL